MSINLFTKSPYSEKIFKSLWEITKVVLETVDFQEAVQRVVNIILDQLDYLQYGYHVIVLSLLDEQSQCLKRIAISKTEAAGKFLKASPIPFQEIIIPLSAKDNISVRAITERKIFVTNQVSDVLYPALAKEWVSDFQKNLGIKTSIVFPILVGNKILGTLIFSLNKDRSKITKEEWTILDAFVGAVGIALDNALLFKSLTEATEQLRVANERLGEVDKLKDEFVSLASHELRTPMTVIKSYVWMLLNDSSVQLSEKQKKYLEKTLSSTQRLINLVNDMLNVSRIESGKLTVEPVPTDVCKLVSEVAAEMQARAAEVGINLSYTQPGSPLMANVDIDKIKEVVINLIGNSLKFTPKGGSVTITVDENIKDFALVKVKDTGRGISSNDMPKLFKKFNMVGDGHLTKDQGQGTGLGLYLSKSLVELHGGRIWVESEGEGKGATFLFTLPLGNNSLSQQATQIKTVVGPQAPEDSAVPGKQQKTDKYLPPAPNPQE